MHVNRTVRSAVIAVLILSLTGCGLDPTSNFDNGTLFAGKQQWEIKRHADDWIVPLTDGLAIVGVVLLGEAIEGAIDTALDHAFPQPNQREHENAPAYPPQCNNP